MFIMTAFTVDVSAQYRGKKKKKKKTTSDRKSDYFDESGGDIKNKLWYGADVNLNFGAFNGQSSFTIGLSPMVGYKITDNFSLGPRLSVLNTNFKINQGPGVEDISLNSLDIGGGIFARHKILQNYFIHTEYEIVSEEFPTGVIMNNRAETERFANSHYYLGAGYGGSSGGIGFTTYALWDFSQEFTSQNIPIIVRFGITYNF